MLIEAREILSGETGRTSGHLANDLDDGYTAIAQKHGDDGAKVAAESHTWALNRVGEISKQLGIECEYRKLPGYDISQYPREAKEHANDLKEIRQDGVKARALGIPTKYEEGFAIKGWNGSIDQRDAVIYEGQATFHPTKYDIGVLHFLKQQPNFQYYTYTRAVEIEEKGVEVLGMGHKDVYITTLDGHKIKCHDAVEATCAYTPRNKIALMHQVISYGVFGTFEPDILARIQLTSSLHPRRTSPETFRHRRRRVLPHLLHRGPRPQRLHRRLPPIRLRRILQLRTAHRMRRVKRLPSRRWRRPQSRPKRYARSLPRTRNVNPRSLSASDDS